MAAPGVHDVSTVSITILGCGAGATQPFHGQPSSAFALLLNDKPVLLADIGFGVVRSALQHIGTIPPCIYVSHNHSDHAGELPIALHVEAAAGRKKRLLAHADVMPRLLEHRLAELQSTRQPLDNFATIEATTEAGHTMVTPDGSVTIKSVHSQHSELCYGAILYWRGRPVLGWTADSGCNTDMYSKLAIAPCLLVDARAKGSYEHASFEEAGQLAQQLAPQGKQVLITGYGCHHEAPDPSNPVLCGAQPVKPGQRIVLWRQQESEADAGASLVLSLAT